jgi:hypothetical protein
MELCNPLTNVNDLRLMIRSQYALPKGYATKMNRKQVCNAVQKCSGKDLPLPPLRYQKVNPTTGVYYPRDTPLSGRDFYILFSKPKIKELQRIAKKLGVFQVGSTRDMLFMSITEFLKASGVPEPVQVRLYPNKANARSPRSVLNNNNNLKLSNNNNLKLSNNNNLKPRTTNNLRPPPPRRVGPPIGGPTPRPRNNISAPPPPQRRIPLPPTATPRLKDYEELMRKAKYGNESSLRSWGKTRGFNVNRYGSKNELFNAMRRQQRDKLNVEDLKTLAKSLGMKNTSSYKTKNGLERAISEFKKKTPIMNLKPTRPPPLPVRKPPPLAVRRPSPQMVEVTKAIKTKNVSKLRNLENSTNSNVAKTAREARVAVETNNNTKLRRVAEDANKTALRNLRMYASRSGVKNTGKYNKVETLERAIRNAEGPNAALNAKIKETRAAANAARAAKNNKRVAELKEREMKLVAQLEKNKTAATEKLEREKSELNAKLVQKKAEANAAKASKNTRLAAKLEQEKVKLAANLERKKAEVNAAKASNKTKANAVAANLERKKATNNTKLAAKLEQEKMELAANLERKKAEANAAKAANNTKLAAKLEQEKMELAARLERKKAEANAARSKPGLNFSLPNIQIPKFQRASPEVRAARREKLKGIFTREPKKSEPKKNNGKKSLIYRMFASNVQKIFDEVYPGVEAGTKKEANKFVAAIKNKGKNASSVNAIYSEVYGSEAQLRAEGRNNSEISSIMAKRALFKRKLLGAVATVAKEAGVSQAEVTQVVNEEPKQNKQAVRVFERIYSINVDRDPDKLAKEFLNKFVESPPKNMKNIETFFRSVYGPRNDIGENLRKKRDQFARQYFDKSESNLKNNKANELVSKYTNGIPRVVKEALNKVKSASPNNKDEAVEKLNNIIKNYNKRIINASKTLSKAINNRDARVSEKVTERAKEFGNKLKAGVEKTKQTKENNEIIKRLSNKVEIAKQLKMNVNKYNNDTGSLNMNQIKKQNAEIDGDIRNYLQKIAKEVVVTQRTTYNNNGKEIVKTNMKPGGKLNELNTKLLNKYKNVPEIKNYLNSFGNKQPVPQEKINSVINKQKFLAQADKIINQIQLMPNGINNARKAINNAKTPEEARAKFAAFSDLIIKKLKEEVGSTSNTPQNIAVAATKARPTPELLKRLKDLKMLNAGRNTSGAIDQAIKKVEKRIPLYKKLLKLLKLGNSNNWNATKAAAKKQSNKKEIEKLLGELNIKRTLENKKEIKEFLEAFKIENLPENKKNQFESLMNEMRTSRFKSNQNTRIAKITQEKLSQKRNQNLITQLNNARNVLRKLGSISATNNADILNQVYEKHIKPSGTAFESTPPKWFASYEKLERHVKRNGLARKKLNSIKLEKVKSNQILKNKIHKAKSIAEINKILQSQPQPPNNNFISNEMERKENKIISENEARKIFNSFKKNFNGKQLNTFEKKDFNPLLKKYRANKTGNNSTKFIELMKLKKYVEARKSKPNTITENNVRAAEEAGARERGSMKKRLQLPLNNKTLINRVKYWITSSGQKTSIELSNEEVEAVKRSNEFSGGEYILKKSVLMYEPGQRARPIRRRAIVPKKDKPEQNNRQARINNRIATFKRDHGENILPVNIERITGLIKENTISNENLNEKIKDARAKSLAKNINTKREELLRKINSKEQIGTLNPEIQIPDNLRNSRMVKMARSTYDEIYGRIKTKKAEQIIFSLKGKISPLSDFRTINKNGDGKITLEEFKKGVKTKKLNINDEEIELIFNFIDKNNNKGITYSELQTYFPPVGTSRIQTAMGQTPNSGRPTGKTLGPIQIKAEITKLWNNKKFINLLSELNKRYIKILAGNGIPIANSDIISIRGILNSVIVKLSKQPDKNETLLNFIGESLKRLPKPT